jgi:hypothetical protein
MAFLGPFRLMIDDFLEERAALYVAGTMTPDERDEFELLLKSHPELQLLVYDLQQAASAIVFSQLRPEGPELPAALKSKILQTIATETRLP